MDTPSAQISKGLPLMPYIEAFLSKLSGLIKKYVPAYNRAQSKIKN